MLAPAGIARRFVEQSKNKRSLKPVVESPKNRAARAHKSPDMHHQCLSGLYVEVFRVLYPSYTLEVDVRRVGANTTLGGGERIHSRDVLGGQLHVH